MRRLAFPLWCTLVGLAGCTSTVGTGRYEAALCDAMSRCAAGSACRDGLCHTTCTTDADCPSGAACRDGLCWAAVSGACTTDADCAPSEVCAGGSCATPPSPIGCTTDADCPAGTLCDARGSCVTTCGAEACGDGIDGDCDGLVDEGCTATDADGDGFDGASDCDDTDATIHPGAAEACNRVDDDCDGAVDESGCACTTDADCAPGELCTSGACAPSGVCRTDSECAPGQACVSGRCTATCGAELCGNGVDDDCDGAVDEGCGSTCATDADCAAGELCLSGRCSPATCVSEICGNGIDDDCDGLIDDGCSSDADGDGYSVPSDCDDADASVHPSASETCDGRDEDCDGLVDDGCSAPACRTDAECAAGQVCVAGVCRAP